MVGNIGAKTLEDLGRRNKQSTREEMVSSQGVSLVACWGTTQMKVLVPTSMGRVKWTDGVWWVRKAVENLLGSSALARWYSLVRQLTNGTALHAKPRVSDHTPSDTDHFLDFILLTQVSNSLALTRTYTLISNQNCSCQQQRWLNQKHMCSAGDECLSCPSSITQNITNVLLPCGWQSMQRDKKTNPIQSRHSLTLSRRGDQRTSRSPCQPDTSNFMSMDPLLPLQS